MGSNVTKPNLQLPPTSKRKIEPPRSNLKKPLLQEERVTLGKRVKTGVSRKTSVPWRILGTLHCPLKLKENIRYAISQDCSTSFFFLCTVTHGAQVDLKQDLSILLVLFVRDISLLRGGMVNWRLLRGEEWRGILGEKLENHKTN